MSDNKDFTPAQVIALQIIFALLSIGLVWLVYISLVKEASLQ